MENIENKALIAETAAENVNNENINAENIIEASAAINENVKLKKTPAKNRVASFVVGILFFIGSSLFTIFTSIPLIQEVFNKSSSTLSTNLSKLVALLFLIPAVISTIVSAPCLLSSRKSIVKGVKITSYILLAFVAVNVVLNIIAGISVVSLLLSI